MKPHLYAIFLFSGMSLLLESYGQAQDPLFDRLVINNATNATSDSLGVAFCDFDNNGRLDVFFPNVNRGPSRLYANGTNGFFQEIIFTNFLVDVGTFVGSAWGDFNNDGWEDLFIANYAFGNATGVNYLYENSGGRGLSRRFPPPLSTDHGLSVSAAWGDYDADGFLDLFVANNGGVNFLYRNTRNGGFSRVTTGEIATDNADHAFLPDYNYYGSETPAWVDYDNDGDLDLYVANKNLQNNFLYRNRGNGTFEKITNSLITMDRSSTESGVWGDFNNDGLFDLFLANRGQERNQLYLNGPAGSFARITNGAIVTDVSRSYGASWVDYDNDGWLDMFVANQEEFNEFLYHNQGNGTFTKITNSIVVLDQKHSWGCAWGDYDNDGFQDLIVCNSGQNSVLFRNKGNSNHWINIKCVGTRSNRSAIGSKLRVLAEIGGTNFWQLRQITGGDGYGSQNDRRASFGLGAATNILVLRIEWPSGLVEETENVAPDQFLVLTEGTIGFPVRLGLPQVSSNRVDLNLQLRPGLAFELQYSTNLFNWMPLFPGVTSTNVTPMTHWNPPTNQAFYRVRLP